ncbi:hypothetical protein [Bacillus massilioanorexius]|nr:hypothetical protein [Bacillus massilioanorexius]
MSSTLNWTISDSIKTCFEKEQVNFFVDESKNVYVCISKKNPTNHEIASINSQKVRFRFYELGDAIFSIVCFGEDQLYKLPYNPFETSIASYKGLGKTLTVILADLSTKTVYTKYELEMGDCFRYYLESHWENAMHNPECDDFFYDIYHSMEEIPLHQVFLDCPNEVEWYR